MALYDMHLKLGDIKGESKHSDHPGEIMVETFHLGGEQQGTGSFGGGSGAGKAKIHDAQFTTKCDKSSPFLFQYMANGKHLDDSKLVCRKAGGKQEKFLEFTFKEVLISSCQFAAHSGGDVLPTIQFSLNFGEASVEYFEQSKDGKTTSSGKKTVNIREMKFT